MRIRYFHPQAFERLSLEGTRAPYVLLETLRADKENVHSYLFRDPLRVLICGPGDDAKRFLISIDEALKRGYWIAGFFSYEFGYMLEHVLRGCLPGNLSVPLAWIGVFRTPRVIAHSPFTRFKPDAAQENRFSIETEPCLAQKSYQEAIIRIKRYLREGETYQINFTFPIRCSVQEKQDALYEALCASQPTAYTARIDTGHERIFTFSPELFFRTENDVIITRPMKGTSSRGRFLEEDRRKKIQLKRSVKNKAENLMIVDLLRNDLGKIARKGTVRTEDLFSIERHNTVFQMTSTVRGRLWPRTPFSRILTALFPSGSVTGAPKIRTMQLIRELEASPRGIYTGAIGFASPGGRSCFNVAIRTVHIRGPRQITLGVGGGIVYDSNGSREYAEALLKSRFMTSSSRRFHLIETIRLDESGYWLLEFHLARLRSSCAYFGIPLDIPVVRKYLRETRKKISGSGSQKVRLLIDTNGGLSVTSAPLNPDPGPWKITISTVPVDSRDLFLYHKTTRRAQFEREKKRARQRGFREVLFINEQGQLTEGATTNIFLRRHSTLYTPLRESGLLDGVLRRWMLAGQRAVEKILLPEDLFTADEVFVGNSVRGLIRADICSLPRETELLQVAS